MSFLFKAVVCAMNEGPATNDRNRLLIATIVDNRASTFIEQTGEAFLYACVKQTKDLTVRLICGRGAAAMEHYRQNLANLNEHCLVSLCSPTLLNMMVGCEKDLALLYHHCLGCAKAVADFLWVVV